MTHISPETAVAVFIGCVTMAIPFGILFYRKYQKILNESGVDIWLNPVNNLRLMFLGRIDGVKVENIDDLRKARLYQIIWNILFLPGGFMFMAYILGR